MHVRLSRSRAGAPQQWVGGSHALQIHNERGKSLSAPIQETLGEHQLYSVLMQSPLVSHRLTLNFIVILKWDISPLARCVCLAKNPGTAFGEHQMWDNNCSSNLITTPRCW
jgi:ribosomal protein L11 methylase PrmA